MSTRAHGSLPVVGGLLLASAYLGCSSEATRAGSAGSGPLPSYAGAAPGVEASGPDEAEGDVSPTPEVDDAEDRTISESDDASRGAEARETPSSPEDSEQTAAEVSTEREEPEAPNPPEGSETVPETPPPARDDVSTDRELFGLGGASLCAAGGFAICEGFEQASVGAQAPAGWTSDGYGNRSLTIVDDDCARGDQCLLVDVAGDQTAVVGMIVRRDVGALGARHFGRSFMKIDAPAPTGFVHWDAFEARGTFNGQVNMVRWASTGTNVGGGADNWSWIYNVQTTNSGEFGTEGPRSAHPTAGQWMCLEWLFDAAAQEARFWYEGAEVDYLHIDSERSEIPTFDSFHVGFQKFQPSAAFRVRVDEVAFDDERIGCNN